MRTTVLLPESLYGMLKQIAEEERRSTHKQIIVALEKFVMERRRPTAPPPALGPAGGGTKT